MKTLFEEDERYSPLGLHFLREITKAVKPIIKGYAAKGYSIREISHIAQSAIGDFEVEYILTSQVKKVKDKRKVKKRFAIDLGTIPTNPP